MEQNQAKRIFLSHKGIDKDQVNDFKNTLSVLGFSPWIDEDAMPAGTSLERGLLKGMQDSCGVVFFITPNFQDRGFLETEINYAINEKRKKGDQFAIISLQFSDDKGRKGDIPDLLTSYVWKSPKNHLEALREIIKALPIKLNEPDWKEGIDGVVSLPKIKSTTTELSTEAKLLLKEAIKGDGTIHRFKIRGSLSISCNGKNVVPNNDSRTNALWEGGLEDLQRHRYIKDTGHKGNIFEVTREGFEIAESFS